VVFMRHHGPTLHLAMGRDGIPINPTGRPASSGKRPRPREEGETAEPLI
jgi:hypothetical protein